MTNPYQSPPEQPLAALRPRSRSLIIVSTLIVLAAALGVGLVLVQDRFRRMFEEFDMALSTLSQVCLNPALPVVMAGFVLLAALRELLFPSHRWLSVWNVLLILLLASGIVLFAFGLLLPLAQLMENLQ
jgi:hypothetical protein